MARRLDDGFVHIATQCHILESCSHIGNLGRAGYGASLEGMWPYSYDSCDWGTLPNQTLPGAQPPSDTKSFLPGQRLSACTCTNIKDGSHPGPMTNGRYVGRSAPELDIFEAEVTTKGGEASQSLQLVAPPHLLS